MRSYKQLVRAAVGDPDFDLMNRIKEEDVGEFKSVRVSLKQDRYRGLPPVWHFFVLEGREKPRPKEEIARLMNEARRIASGVDTGNPILLLSDDSSVHFDDELRPDNPNIFFLDQTDLPGQGRAVGKVRLAPFMRATRRRLSHSDLSNLIFAPYEPNVPARGWRFFGRKRELNHLVNSRANYMVVGPRKIGKTSLLQEAEQRLAEKGVKVFYLDVEHCKDASDVVKALSLRLSARDLYTAHRRSEALDQSLLSSILAKVCGQHGRVVLILDELGNVVFRNPGGDWRVVGLLRSYSQRGQLRVIMSAFQDYFLDKITDFEGPFVNFASLMRLTGFTNREIEEALADPLGIWANINDRPDFVSFVGREIGRQPFLLQYFGLAVFEELMSGGGKDVLAASRKVLRNRLDIFEPAVEEMFVRLPSSAVRYMFLRRCWEARQSGLPLTEAEVDDDWVEGVLKSLNYKSTFAGRRKLIERLETRGLSTTIGGERGRQKIDAPVVYRYLETYTVNLERLMRKLGEEIELSQRELVLA